MGKQRRKQRHDRTNNIRQAGPSENLAEIGRLYTMRYMFEESKHLPPR